jgi:hypothetical protein
MEWHVTLGVLVAQQAKVTRAAQAIDLISGGIALTTFDTYRSLTGLLEHLLVFSAGDRTLMDHLYGANFRRGQICGPLTVMVFGELQLDSLRRWRHTLMRSSGCLFASAFKLASVARPRLQERLQASELFVPRPLTPGRFYLFSDAASDGRSGGGIGGWVHGEWWHLKVSKKNAGLIHITALELIGAGINIILYGDLLAGCDVALCVDALSSAQVIAAGSAHSAALAVVWGLIRAFPQYAAFAAHGNPRVR